MELANMPQEAMPIVKIEDGKPVADSRDVATYFGKRHDGVLRDIRGLHCSDEFRFHNFVELKINDLSGKGLHVTRDYDT